MRHQAGTGSELLDWQEVWCFRCKHDHDLTHTLEGDGCTIMANGIVDHGESIAEWIDSAYTIEYLDESGAAHTYDIPNVCNSIPAATVCTAFELCDEPCRTHVNGTVIVGITWPPTTLTDQ